MINLKLAPLYIYFSSSSLNALELNLFKSKINFKFKAGTTLKHK